ncbi:hypothetical protein F2Q70_00011318 [Brassica cretica]|uniref:Uncharacterized protein n=2 Tax=Brassica cretica TaxID=69181 RepID=A0A8S9MD01_BRACR|nr:hypothetical protein F2Q68_00004451 [Brassica cretica]KAF2616088.1 hypothetical protein F2Q70_00011318 [Brassica cretica]KAF3542574.1 hypothetical protein DY000_02006507 [Brassica cretica]
MPVLLKGGQSTPSSTADGRAGSTKQPARPSAELNQSSWADGRAGSTKRPARRMVELDRQRMAELDQSVRRMAELDRQHDQLGGWPSWIEHATSSADG